MTRFSITLPDSVGEAAKQAAGGNVSGWVANLVREALMNRAGQAAGAYDRERDDAEWEAERLGGAA